MTAISGVHDDHGATYREVGDRRVVAHYGRPTRTHRAVRNGVGVTEHPFDVVGVTGEDRHAFVDDAVSNRVPDADGAGVYALLCDPDGHVETTLYAFDAGERLLLFVPPGRGEPLAADWREKTFIQDVGIDVRSDMVVFGIHGPDATEKVASVFADEGAPADPLTFVRGKMAEVGVTVVRDDGLVGETGYFVVAAAERAGDLFETLSVRGLNATPFGYDTWETLTLEAGTPLFASDIAGRLPNAVGLRNALDFEKGCFVGQEVVSRIENRGRPPERLVGLAPESLPEDGAAVLVDGDEVGTVTRAAESHTLDRPVALALVAWDRADADLSVRTDDEVVAAVRRPLPFVEGSAESARRPRYD